MNILVTGANGFLGQHLTLFLAAKGLRVWATGRNECRIPGKQVFEYISADLTGRDAVNELIKTVRPQCVIHTAAMSKPDECLLRPETCLQHNVEATHYLLEASVELSKNVHFIYVSTDFIFGEGGPHTEDTRPEPLNFYGRTKWMAEQLVEQSGLPFCIVRPAFIYGELWEGMRPSFIQWVQQSLAKGQSIKVVGDQYRTPTYVLDLCAGIYAIATQLKTGPFHLAGDEVVTPYQLAVTTAEVLGLDKALIEEVSAQTFKEPVQRAKSSGLKIDKARQELGYSPVTCKEGIARSFNYF
ncbi:SDR family oxidoreductase [Deminuibacter soli]|uniref:dTDP-4-dehydrorhamnose reductase n=1 Tax=Deminuibacter soli TaxID=2291815 RepID=A0A3E1NEA5_9BACT|nr:SDR family oxidoreductase [Deminuibacter soli]RFM26299.1 SDR family NAD(P)-dependent oxidoreductase [Deminuibacter soli]